MFDHYNTFYAETPLEHRSKQIINVIGNFVVTRLNEDFGKTSGIDDFFELSGNDKHEFWFHYSDSAEACLREFVVEFDIGPYHSDDVGGGKGLESTELV